VVVEDLAFTLALHRTPGVGAKTFNDLVTRTGSARAVIEGASASRDLGVSAEVMQALSKPDWAGVDKDLSWAAQPNNQVLTSADPTYPRLLRQLDAPPPVLFVRGCVEVLDSPQLAMVGSRTPTPGGLDNARDFARALAGAGITVTSGLALGIDSAAHQGALAASGFTVAVAGTGLDRVYPARNHALAHQIAEHGAMVSEFPIGTPPKAHHFPQRNRLLSGLSLGTLVVEAALGSGSLITARFAAEQGREIFAIPGSIHNPLARGCHALIREGAKLVETAEHILEELGALLRYSVETPPSLNEVVAWPTLDPEYQVLIDAMGYEPVPLDLLVERTRLTADTVSSMLLILELQGVVSAGVGGCYRLTKGS
jgi:DNA processing protein